jgi:hypothetical protein
MSLLDNAIDNNVNSYDKAVAKAIDLMLQQMTDKLTQLELANGTITGSTANLQYVASLTGDWINALNQSGYYEANTTLINKYDKLVDDMVKIRPDFAVPLSFTGASVEQINALKVLQNETFNILGNQAINQLQTIVINGVTAQMPLSTLLGDLQDSLEGKFKNYAKTYALTAQQQYVQKVEDTSAEEYKANGGTLYWIYAGPLDDLTRPECREALSWGTVDDKTKEAFQAETEPRYNCRHGWQQVTERWFEENKTNDNGNHTLPISMQKNK